MDFSLTDDQKALVDAAADGAPPADDNAEAAEGGGKK
mgnify:CR=1 FL=1